jgi:hypothetical protein
MSSMPKQNRGRSRQDYRTQPEFLHAVVRRFGPIAFDLACSEENMVAPRGFTIKHNALRRDWSKLGLKLKAGDVAWCNPPFSRLDQWSAKGCEVRLARNWTLLLTPYSGAARWWQRYVLGQAMVFGIPRLTFVGCKDPYPKDLALIAYGFGVSGVGFWDWRKEP